MLYWEDYGESWQVAENHKNNGYFKRISDNDFRNGKSFWGPHGTASISPKDIY
jgi:hypothetical protein